MSKRAFFGGGPTNYYDDLESDGPFISVGVDKFSGSVYYDGAPIYDEEEQPVLNFMSPIFYVEPEDDPCQSFDK